MPRRAKLGELVRDAWRQRALAAVRAEVRMINGTFIATDSVIVGFDELVKTVGAARPDLRTSRVYDIANTIAKRDYIYRCGESDEPITMVSSATNDARFLIPHEAQQRREDLKRRGYFMKWGTLGPARRRKIKSS
jgi:hypothetical protein